jgi:hypothetical protein
MIFQYNGPPSGVTLGDGSEMMLMPGAQVDLPEGHDYTKTLLALGQLCPVEAPATETTPQKPGKKNSEATNAS